MLSSLWYIINVDWFHNLFQCSLLWQLDLKLYVCKYKNRFQNHGNAAHHCIQGFRYSLHELECKICFNIDFIDYPSSNCTANYKYISLMLKSMLLKEFFQKPRFPSLTTPQSSRPKHFTMYNYDCAFMSQQYQHVESKTGLL